MRRPGPRSAAPHEAAGVGHSPDEQGWWRRVWRRLMPPQDAELVLGQRSRLLAVLEAARTELDAGWVQGGWWATSSSDGSPRLVTGYAPQGGHPDHVDGVCLVGALVRAGSLRAGSLRAGSGVAGSGAAEARSDVGRAVDAVYESLWASRGQPGAPPPGVLPPVPPPDVRLARVRTLTQWNDQAGRTRAEVLAVIDRAISATIMDLMAAPRPAGAEPAAAAAGAGAG